MTDHINSKLNTQRSYLFMDRVDNEIEDHETRIKEFNSIWYTDGSKTSEGVGLGLYSSSKTLSLSLGKELTIFQAEVLVILKCAEHLLAKQTKNQNLLICSDSELSLKALKKDMINSKKCEKLAQQNSVTLK